MRNEIALQLSNGCFVGLLFLEGLPRKLACRIELECWMDDDGINYHIGLLGQMLVSCVMVMSWPI
jgi:hypothetical protein